MDELGVSISPAEQRIPLAYIRYGQCDTRLEVHRAQCDPSDIPNGADDAELGYWFYRTFEAEMEKMQSDPCHLSKTLSDLEQKYVALEQEYSEYRKIHSREHAILRHSKDKLVELLNKLEHKNSHLKRRLSRLTEKIFERNRRSWKDACADDEAQESFKGKNVDVRPRSKSWSCSGTYTGS